MDIQTFNNTRFGQGMTAIYMGQIYAVGSANFAEKLFGLVNDDDFIWVRCENIELVTEQTP